MSALLTSRKGEEFSVKKRPNATERWQQDETGTGISDVTASSGSIQEKRQDLNISDWASMLSLSETAERGNLINHSFNKSAFHKISKG